MPTLSPLENTDEFEVKEDDRGNLTITFTKKVVFKKGDNIFIYNPFS